MSGSLIVRVKRRREDAPTDQLCIISDDVRAKRIDLGRSISKLTLERTEEDGDVTSVNTATDGETSRLLLQRVETLDNNTGDKHAIQATRKRARASSVGSEGSAHYEDGTKKNMSIYVTNSRRVVKTKRKGHLLFLTWHKWRAQA